MTTLLTMAKHIIEEQELIIGPIAWNEAEKVAGMKVSYATREIKLDDETSAATIERLVHQYERLFGRASLEVCKEAVRDIIADVPPEQVPALLK